MLAISYQRQELFLFEDIKVNFYFIYKNFPLSRNVCDPIYLFMKLDLAVYLRCLLRIFNSIEFF